MYIVREVVGKLEGEGKLVGKRARKVRYIRLQVDKIQEMRQVNWDNKLNLYRVLAYFVLQNLTNCVCQFTVQ